MSRIVKGVYSYESLPKNKREDEQRHKWAYTGRISNAKTKAEEIEILQGLNLEFSNLLSKKDYEVVDLGGAAGLDFFRLRPSKDYKNPWTILEVPFCIPFYEQFAKDYPNLSYLDSYQGIKGKTNMDKVLFSRGTLQYIEEWIPKIKNVLDNFKIVYFAEVVIGSEHFYTYQKEVGYAEVVTKEEILNLFNNTWDIKIIDTNSGVPYLDMDIEDKNIYGHLNILAVKKDGV